MATRYKHIYRGIVIQNDDPSDLGRVKVFVPEVNITLFKDWNNKLDKDKMWNTLGGNTESSISPDILFRLKSKLPWGHVMYPVVGAKSGDYWSERNLAYDSNCAFVDAPSKKASSEPTKDATSATNGSGLSNRHPSASNKNIPKTNGSAINKQAFLSTNPNQTNNIALVDPSVIPYGSIIELPGKNGPLQFVAGSTSDDILNRTDAKKHGSNLPVISLPSITNEEFPFGSHPIIIYPYTGDQKSLNIPKISNNLSNTSSTKVEEIPGSIFSKDSNETYEVKIHYNRDGSIRSFSKSSNINAIVGNNGDILLIDPKTNDSRLLNIPSTKGIIVDDFFPTLSKSNPKTPEEVYKTRLNTTSKVVAASNNISIINQKGSAKSSNLTSDSIQNIVSSNGNTIIYTKQASIPFKINLLYGDNGNIKKITSSDNITTKTTSRGEVIAYDSLNKEIMKIPSNKRSNFIDHLFPNKPINNTSNTSRVPPFAVTPDSINPSNINTYVTAKNKSALQKFKSNGGDLSTTITEQSSSLAKNSSNISLTPTPITEKGFQGARENIDNFPPEINLNIGGNNVTCTIKTSYGAEVNGTGNKPGSNCQTRWLKRHGSNTTNLGNNLKGIISIPEVQSHVWVMFERGDPNYPIVIGTMFNQEDIRGIFRQQEETP